MGKTVKIRLFPDGRIQADMDGFVGPACTDYAKTLEKILEAKTVKVDYKPEYYKSEDNALEDTQSQQVSDKDR